MGCFSSRSSVRFFASLRVDIGNFASDVVSNRRAMIQDERVEAAANEAPHPAIAAAPPLVVRSPSNTESSQITRQNSLPEQMAETARRADPSISDAPCSPEIQAILQAILKIWSPSMSFASTMTDTPCVWTARRDGETFSVDTWGKHPNERDIPQPPRWTMLEATRVTPIPDLTYFSYPRIRGSLDWQDMSQAVVAIKARLFKSCLVAPLLNSEGQQVGCIGFVTSSPKTFDSGDCRMMANIAELTIREIDSNCTAESNQQEDRQGHFFFSNVDEASGGFSSRVHTETDSSSAGMSFRPVGTGRKVMASFDEFLGGQGQVTSPTSAAKNNRDAGDPNSVILLVDTKSPQWTVVYASSSLSALTGLTPDLAIGSSIHSLFVGSSKGGEEAGGSPSSIVQEGLRAEAEVGKAFVMQQVHVKKDLVPQRSLSSDEKPKQTFMLSFRPGSLQPLDSLAPLWDLPQGLPPSRDQRLLGFYFARIHLVNERQDFGLDRSQSSIFSSMAMTDEKTHQTLQINPLLGISVLFEGLAPVSVLGQGALGTVYKCTWHEAPVAVKVQDYLIKGQGDLWRAEVEVELGESLDHINIVRTVAHAAHFLDKDDYMSSQPSWAMNFASEQFNDPYFSQGNVNQMVVLANQEIQARDAKFTGEMEVTSKSPLAAPVIPGESLRAKRRASLILSHAANAASEASSASLVTLGNGIVSLQNADSSLRSAPQNAQVSSYIDFQQNSNASSSLAHLLEARVSTSLVDILMEHASQGPGSLKANYLLSHKISPILEEVEITRNSQDKRLFLHAAHAAPYDSSSVELSPAASEILAKLISARNSSQSKSAGISRTNTYTRLGSALSQTSSQDNASLSDRGDSKNPKYPPDRRMSATSMNSNPSRKGLPPPNVPSGGELRPSSNHTVTSSMSRPTSCYPSGTASHGDAASDTHISTWHTVAPGDMAANASLWYGSQSAGGSSVVSPLLGSLITTVELSSTTAALARGPSDFEQNVNNPTIDLKAMMSLMMSNGSSSGNAQDAGGPSHDFASAFPLRQPRPLSPKNSSALEAEAPIWQSADGRAGSAPGPSQGSPTPSPTLSSTPTPVDQSASPSPMIQFPVRLRLYSVMEFVDKGSLQDAVDRGWFKVMSREGKEGLNMPWILETLAEVASALCYMHSKGSVHGDLSAVNVLLKSSTKHQPRGWFGKICDFGQSVRLKPGQVSIKTTQFGTVNYCSPEVLSHRMVSCASDVWSLGILLNQCVTGHKPWRSMSPEQIMVTVGVDQKQKLPWPEELDPEVTELGKNLLSFNPLERPSAAEAKQELLRILEKLKIQTLNDVQAGSNAGPVSL